MPPVVENNQQQEDTDQQSHCFWCRPQDPSFHRANDRFTIEAQHHRAEVPPYLSASVKAGNPVSPKFPHEPEWAHELSPNDCLNLNDLEVIGPIRKFTHIRCPRAISRCPGDKQYPCHSDSLIISCHGACPSNDTTNSTQSSYGLFHGPSDTAARFNIGSRITEPAESIQTPTSQLADLWAAIKALEDGAQFAKHGGQWDCDPKRCEKLHGSDMVGSMGCKIYHLIIKSDSAYLVNSVTEYLARWIQTGWRTANKKPIKNQDLGNMLVEKINDVQRFGAAVQVWFVDKETNGDAVRLAQSALRPDTVIRKGLDTDSSARY